MSNERTPASIARFRAMQSVVSAELHLREAEERLRIRRANPHADADTIALYENGVAHAQEGLAAAHYTRGALEHADSLATRLASAEGERDELRKAIIAILDNSRSPTGPVGTPTRFIDVAVLDAAALVVTSPANPEAL